MPGRAFWIRLSLAYGIPVPILQEIIDSQHYAELIAFERMHTLDPDGWQQTGILAAQHYNANRGKQDPPAKPTDFMPIVRRHQQQQTVEQMQSVMRSQMKRNNRRIAQNRAMIVADDEGN